MLLALRCPVCGAAGPAPCPSCAAGLRPSPPGPVPALLDGVAALVAYEGTGRELVARLKYRNQRALLGRLAAAMAALVTGPVVDAVTWVPTTAVRRRQRGFDQAELLARAVAGHLGRPCLPLLVRGPGPPQTGRSGAQRRAGPCLVARSRPPALGHWPAMVLVVDDVVTTGATLTSAARALRSAGVREVRGLALARTPRVPRNARLAR